MNGVRLHCHALPVRISGGRLLRRLFAFGLAMVLSFCATSPAAAAPTDYQVKAVFLFNFAQFVEWPSNAFANENSDMVIGILGDDPFGAILDQTVKGEVVHGRKIAVRRLSAEDSVDGCQILFISRSESDRVESLLRSLRGTSILTVSEQDRFCEQGGIINFVRRDQNVRLEINRPVAESAGLKINARLLSLARLVETETPTARTQP